MKLFVVLSRFPYPLEKGDKLRAFNQIKELQKYFDIFVFCLSDRKINTEEIAFVSQFCKELHILKLSKQSIYLNTVKQIFTENPYQIGYFYNRKHKLFIHEAIRRIEPDHIYCQLIRTSEYVKDIHDITKTIDYMDALGHGMIRRASMSNGIKKMMFNSEGKRLLKYEHRIFDYFNNHTIISEQDQKLISHPNNTTIRVIENGIDTRFFEKIPIERSWELVFVGNMNYAPNVACAKYIVTEILPALRKKNENISVLLSGANPCEEVLALKKHKNVTVTGWVKDIRKSYSSAQLFLAPLFIGTGLQNKLLEAMAQEIPCITTSLANNALKATKDIEIKVANTKSEFISGILELLQNPELSAKIGKAGKEYVQKTFSWKNSVEKLNKVFTS